MRFPRAEGSARLVLSACSSRTVSRCRAAQVVVLSHMARKPRAAQLVAWAIIPQYFVAMFSLTLVIAFALAVTEPGADYATPPSAPPEL